MADLNTKYLDYTGLGIFLSKLKEYIENRISEINGTNLNLNASGVDNPTITSQIEDLWATIGTTDGSDGSIIENIEKILDEYVKSISIPTSQSQPLKLVITEGTEDNKDRFVIELQDNGLSNTLNTLSSIDAQLTTNISDEVTARQNADNALDERLDTIEGSYVKSVKVTGTNGITATPATATNGEVLISINGQGLQESITALGKVVNLNGVYAEGTALDTINGNDGDFIIVGQKEYVYWSTATTGVDGTNWVLLGDTTLLSQYLYNLINNYNNHTHAFTPTGTVTSVFHGNEISHNHTFIGDLNTTSNNSLTISYNSGKLNINTLHNHTVTPTGEISTISIIPTGTVTSVFGGENNTSEVTNLIQTLPSPETPSIEVEIDETSINILSNAGITEDSITITGDNITIENNENNYNLIIE